MSPLRNLVWTITVPALATAVIGASAGVSVPSGPKIDTRSDQVSLMASIDTASNAVGISESSLYFMDQSDLNTAMNELQTMGVTQVRVLLPWEYMEPTSGGYSWTQSDQLLSTAAKYGISVDAVITSSPTWASSYSAGGLIPDAAPNASADAAYAAFAAAVASRYTSKISAIEVWNEPNGNTGWYPTPDAAAYTQLLKDAYAAIKAADPNITVVGGVLGAGVTIGTATVNPVTFLQQMYADGAAGFFDALSFHPYNYSSTFSSGSTFANSAIQQLEALRALMNANGDAAKLIWATEYGEPSSETGGQAQQAAYIQDFLTSWSALTGVGPMFIYSLLDDTEGDNLGLFTDNWTAKAAVAVVEAWLAAHPTTTAPTSALGSIVTAIGNAAKALVSAVANLVTGVTSAVQHLVSGISTAVSNLIKALSTAISSAVTSAAGAISHAAVAMAATAKTKTTAAVTISPAATASTLVSTSDASVKKSAPSAHSNAPSSPRATAATAGTSTSSTTASGHNGKQDNKKPDTGSGTGTGTGKQSHPNGSDKGGPQNPRHAA